MRQTSRLFVAMAALALCFVVPLRAEDKPKSDIDFNRAREIYERQQKGEKVSADDQAYLEKAIAAKKAGEAGRADHPPASVHCRVAGRPIHARP